MATKPERADQMDALYEAGKSLREVAEIMNVSHEWVRKSLLRRGKLVRGRGGFWRRPQKPRLVCLKRGCSNRCNGSRIYCSRACKPQRQPAPFAPGGWRARAWAGLEAGLPFVDAVRAAGIPENKVRFKAWTFSAQVHDRAEAGIPIPPLKQPCRRCGRIRTIARSAAKSQSSWTCCRRPANAGTPS